MINFQFFPLHWRCGGQAIFNNFKKLILVIGFFVLFPFLTVRAAELRFESQTEKVVVNSEFKLDLVLDAQGDDVNAIGAEMLWHEDLELRNILTNESMISLWTERPVYDGAWFKFSGVMPGGYSGSYTPYKVGPQPGKVLTLLIRPKKNGDYLIKFQNLELYPNDGSGKAIDIKSPEFKFNVYGDAAPASGDPTVILADKTAPHDLTVSVERDPAIADGKWFVVVNAIDNETGIKGYYIQETKNSTPDDNWIPIGNPFILTDQSRSSNIFIKALDLNNNEAVTKILASSTVAVDKTAKRYSSNYFLWTIIALVLFVILALLRIIKHKR